MDDPGTPAMRVNGRLDVAAASSIAELLRRHGIDASARFIAVAVNGSVVRRGDWERTSLKPGDDVEVVRPLTGG